MKKDKHHMTNNKDHTKMTKPYKNIYNPYDK